MPDPAHDVADLLVDVMPDLMAYAVSLTRDRQAASDLVQSAAVRALASADQFESGTNFKGWAFTILRNVFLDEVRRRKVRKETTDVDALKDILPCRATQSDGRGLADLMRLIDRLTPEHRTVLMLVCDEGLDYDEAAAALGLEVGTVRSRLCRAKDRLGAMLGIDRPGSLVP